MEPIKENYQQTNSTRPSTHKYPWEKFLEEGIQYLLSHNIDCLPLNIDRLYIKMENGEVVEVEHPDRIKKNYHRPNIRFGMIAGGKNLLTNDYLKTTLCDKCNVLCFDSEIDQVIAAIQGNRTESFMIIRGISDYHDGTLNKEWQPFAALCAAAFMKTIIYKIPKPSRQHPNSHSNSEHDDDIL
jgi:nucleoside phosphorylase